MIQRERSFPEDRRWGEPYAAANVFVVSGGNGELGKEMWGGG